MVKVKKEHTKAEWIAMLEKAKVLALTKYSDTWRINGACREVGIVWNFQEIHNATFGPYLASSSVLYLEIGGNTPERVAAVFDNSIAAIRKM